MNIQTSIPTQTKIDTVKEFLLTLQKNICSQLEAEELAAGSDVNFFIDNWLRDKAGSDNQGGGRSCVLNDGVVIEKAGVMFSHIYIDHMPASATNRYPELAGRKAQAMGVSVVVHPNNPYVPTSHANIRLFVAEKENEKPIWWFGGGFDLTPFYPFVEDCQHWHNVAFDLCQPFGSDIYPKFKKMCDDYFYIPHRDEQRGIGGLFYDDLNEQSMGWSFDTCFEFMQAVGNGYLDAMMPIMQKRKHTRYSSEERDFQLYRRGRYVEFNLVYDRGTIFGLQSKGRIESILVSMPPLASWTYCYTPPINSPEQRLSIDFLKPKYWSTR